MKITQNHIDDLYAFTIKHFVEHYDLQTELVDHLANDIEAFWEAQPNLSYEEAREKAFKKFGICGFMDVVEKRQKAMNKRYLKYLWKELKQWFTLPKVIITIALFLFFYLTFSSQFGKHFFISAFIFIIIWSGYQAIQLNRQFRKRKETYNKKWMLEEIIFKQAGGFGFMFLSQIFNFVNWSGNLLGNNKAVISFSILFTFIYLFYYISCKLLPNKAEELLVKTYPEFSL